MISNSRSETGLFEVCCLMCPCVYDHFAPFQSRVCVSPRFLFLPYFLRFIFPVFQLLFETEVLQTAISRDCDLSLPISYEAPMNIAPFWGSG